MVRLAVAGDTTPHAVEAVGIVASVEHERHVRRLDRPGSRRAARLVLRRQIDDQCLVFRAAAVTGHADSRGAAHVVRDPLPRVRARPLHHEPRQFLEDSPRRGGRRLRPAGRAEHLQGAARRTRQPARSLDPRRGGEPAGLGEMLVGVAAAVEVVVVARVRPREPLGRSEPVRGGASPGVAERQVCLDAGLDRGGVVGDQRQRIERHAEVGGAEILGEAVRAREREPCPPLGLTLGAGVRVGEIAQREQVQNPHQPDVGVPGLHRMAANRRQRVAGHRLEQLAAPGSEPPPLGPWHEPAFVFEPEHREQLRGKLHGVGIGHPLVAEPPAEVAVVGTVRIDHLHRPGQRQGFLHRLGIPAPPRGLDREPQQAPNPDRRIPRPHDHRLRLEVGGGWPSSEPARHAGRHDEDGWPPPATLGSGSIHLPSHPAADGRSAVMEPTRLGPRGRGRRPPAGRPCGRRRPARSSPPPSACSGWAR